MRFYRRGGVVKTVRIQRANEVLSVERPVMPVTIIIDDVQPLSEEMPNWREAARARFREQAKMLVDVLAESLPGGTMHELLICMLERRASLLKVPL